MCLPQLRLSKKQKKKKKQKKAEQVSTQAGAHWLDVCSDLPRYFTDTDILKLLNVEAVIATLVVFA